MATRPVHSSRITSRTGTRAGGNQSGGTRQCQCQRQAITEHFLTALEDVVWRYRALAGDAGHADIAPEAVTAEVAHHLAVARSSLSGHLAVD
jgi:hypothetical protein